MLAAATVMVTAPGTRPPFTLRKSGSAKLGFAFKSLFEEGRLPPYLGSQCPDPAEREAERSAHPGQSLNDAAFAPKWWPRQSNEITARTGKNGSSFQAAVRFGPKDENSAHLQQGSRRDNGYIKLR